MFVHTKSSSQAGMEKIWFRLYILSILDHTSQALGGVTIFSFLGLGFGLGKGLRLQ